MQRGIKIRRTDDGYKIRILTNRPIRFGEAWVNGRSTDYNLSALELDLSNEKGKSTGVLLPASQFKTNKKFSPQQAAAFAKIYPMNARPIQPSNGREILQSK